MVMCSTVGGWAWSVAGGALVLAVAISLVVGLLQRQVGAIWVAVVASHLGGQIPGCGTRVESIERWLPPCVPGGGALLAVVLA